MFKIEKQDNGQWQQITTEATRRAAMAELLRLAQAEPHAAWRAMDSRTGTVMAYPAFYFTLPEHEAIL